MSKIGMTVGNPVIGMTVSVEPTPQKLGQPSPDPKDAPADCGPVAVYRGPEGEYGYEVVTLLEDIPEGAELYLKQRERCNSGACLHDSDCAVHCSDTPAPCNCSAVVGLEPVAWYRTVNGVLAGISWDKVNPDINGWLEFPLVDGNKAADTIAQVVRERDQFHYGYKEACEEIERLHNSVDTLQSVNASLGRQLIAFQKKFPGGVEEFEATYAALAKVKS